MVGKGTALSAVTEGTKKLGQKITEASPEVSDKMKDAALEKTIEKGGGRINRCRHGSYLL